MPRSTRSLLLTALAALGALVLVVGSSAGDRTRGAHHRRHHAHHAHHARSRPAAKPAPKHGSEEPGGTKGQPGGGPQAGPPTFGAAAYVDYKRLGGEPLVAIDRWPFPDGQIRDLIYASSPNGFIDPHYSVFYRSDDLGQTFHVPTHVPIFGATEPNAGGGGDSSIAIGTVTHKVFFADLPGPACDTMNVSNDLGEHWTSDPLGCGPGPGTIDDRQWAAADETYPGAMHVYMSFLNTTNAVAPTLSLARSAHDGAVGSFVTDSTCNTLTLNGAQVDNLPTGPAPDGQATSCPDPADPNLWLAGPLVVDTNGGSPYAHRAYIPFIRSGSAANGGGPWSVEMAVSTTGGLTWTRHHVVSLGVHEPDNLFPVATIDRGGNLYLVWTQTTTDSANTATLGGETDTYLSVSRDGGSTWSTPTLVAPAGNSTVMPWVVAGDPGRIDVSFYRSNTALNPNASFVDASGNECAQGSPGCTANPSVWDVYMAQSLDALSEHPSFSLVKVSEKPNHVGQICTSGLNCTTGGNRNLLDFFSVDVDHTGAAAVIWADDNNANALDRDKLARQLGGASLFANQTVGLGAAWPAQGNGVTDPAGDVLDAQGAPVGTTTGLDLLGAGVSRSGDNLTVTLTLNGPPTAAAAGVGSKGLATGGLWGVEFWSPTNDFYVGYRDNPTDGAPAVEAGTVTAANPTGTSTEFQPTQGGTLGGTCLAAAGAAAGAVGAASGAVGSGTVQGSVGTVQGVVGSVSGAVGSVAGTVGGVVGTSPPRALQSAGDASGTCTLTLTTSLHGLGLGASSPLLSATGLVVYLEGASGPVTSNSELADATAAFDVLG